MEKIIYNTLVKGKLSDILINGNTITAIRDHNAGSYKNSLDSLDGSGTAALPLLHNGHTHSPMVLLRGIGDDMLLDEWLTKKIWPVEAQLTEDDYYWGNRLALLEMIKSGTGFFNEMYMKPESMIDALKDLPIKALINYPIIDGMDDKSGREQAKNCEIFFNKIEVPPNIQLGIALHSIYANSAYSIKWVRDFANERNLNVHIHLCETKKEVDDSHADHNGRSPVEYLDDMGFLNNRVLAAHSVWLNNSDLNIYADRGVTAIHNPVSNMKLVSKKAFPYMEMKNRQIPMVLGTDGAASNNNLDMFEEMKIAALLQKHHYGDPTLLSAEEIFSLATSDSAEIFSTGSGLIEVGAEADIMLVNIDTPQMTPVTNLISNLVYSANGNHVRSLISSGNIIMRDRVVKGEEEIIKNARKCAERLLENK